jgi:hypothetical protein
MADMTGATGGLDARVSELEARIREMERRQHEIGPMRSILRELFPAEARQHIRAARKEQLLAMRAFLDHWIEKVDERGSASSGTRERITLD